MKIRVISPGKLILSGEHAVVYGAVACALAVNQSLEGEYEKREDDYFFIYTEASNKPQALSISKIIELEEILTSRYHQFLNKELEIRDIIHEASDLIWFTMAKVLKVLAPSSLLNKKNRIKGGDIRLKTTIPIGCGMGSSAALIINLILGLNELFHLNLSQEKIIELAISAENIQHGHSSGIDIKLSLMGGCYIFKKNQDFSPVSLSSLPLYYFNSGSPLSSTGECVSFVKKKNFPSCLWEEFDKTTLSFIQALENNHLNDLINAVKKNHRLLCDIGVVPLSIQKLIQEIESQGGAAKICGAGSIEGDQGGIILIVGNMAWPHAHALEKSDKGAYIQGEI